MDMISGNLIQMTTRMVTTEWAEYCMIFGAILLAIGLFCGISMLRENGRKNHKVVMSLITILVFGLAFILYGNSIPREQHILACANGPINLETLAGAYRIVDVDGSLITLMRR